MGPTLQLVRGVRHLKGHPGCGSYCAVSYLSESGPSRGILGGGVPTLQLVMLVSEALQGVGGERSYYAVR